MATSKSETGAEGVLVYDPGRPSRIRDIPTDMRPREELKRRGAAAMDLEKLLAIVMRSGLPGQNVADLARELVLRAGGLENLARMTYLDILGLRLPGIGEVKAMELEAAFEIGRRAASGHEKVDHASRPRESISESSSGSTCTSTSITDGTSSSTASRAASAIRCPSRTVRSPSTTMWTSQ